MTYLKATFTAVVAIIVDFLLPPNAFQAVLELLRTISDKWEPFGEKGALKLASAVWRKCII